MKRIIFIIAAWLAANTFLAANVLTPDFNFLHYTTDNGLPSNCIRDICQDSEGFIWFATDGGLVRFDGVRCVTYLPQQDERVTAAPTYVMALCMRGDEMIAGIANGLYRFDRRLERLQELPLVYPAGMRKIGDGEVKSAACGKDMTLWVSVEGVGVYSIAPDNRVMALYEFPELDNYIATVFCDREGGVWGASTAGTGGIYRLDVAGRRFLSFPLVIEGHKTTLPALSVFEDADGGFWVGTWRDGLMKVDRESGVVTEIPDAKSGNIHHIHSIEQYSTSRLLVGSETGLSLYDITTRRFSHYCQTGHNRRSLSNQFVYPVMKDREGGVWVGTFYGGVNYIAPDTKHIKTFIHSEFANSVSGNVISCLEEDQHGNIWVGSDDGGVCVYDPATDTFRSYSLKPSGSPDNVHALCAHGDKIWVGTYTGGAGTLDPVSGKWTPIPLEGVGTDYSCYAIHKDNHGTVWMAAGKSLNRYDEDNRLFVSHRDLGAWVVDIAEDREGRIWVATQGNGVFLYNPFHDTWENMLPDGKGGGLPHSHVNRITVTADNHVLVATAGGVARYDGYARRFAALSFEGFMGFASSVEKVGDMYWITAPTGLYRCTDERRADRYTSRDGLPSNEFSSGVSLVGRDGRMYLGTVNGLCALFPSDVRSNDYVAPLSFTGLSVINAMTEVGSELLPESLNTIDRLVLSHEDHTFSVYFSALSYANPESNSYVYKLEGFDRDWIKADKDNRATYSNLPPGNYRLHVKAANNDGVWNKDGITLDICVLPVWYASWWMRLVYIVVVVVLFILALRYERRRKETEHNSELARVADNKEREMFRTRLSFFTIVAHEIRTPVSLIIGPLEKIMERAGDFPKTLRDELGMIDRNARRLLSLVNQMLDFKKVEESALPMEFRHMEIMPLVESVVERFRPSVEHRGAELIAEYPAGNFMADVSPESFTKLVSNLLNNARKFTRDRIRLRCAPDMEGKNLVISVEDNGIGIKRENLEKIFTPFYQIIDNINESRGGTGLGLSIVKGVAEGHGGKVVAESEPGKWSCFTVTIPLRQECVLPSEPLPPSCAASQGGVEVASDSAAHTLPLMLVIDDNTEMLDFIASSVSGEFEAVKAENGADALEVLRSREISLIVCDWMMPVMDGLSLLRTVRGDKALNHIPFVMLTAKTDTDSKVESMRAGADAYIEKPFSMAFLKARISNLLDMRRLLREKYSNDPMTPITVLAAHPEDNKFLEQLNSLIEENVSNPDLDVDFLASGLCVSRTGLYSKIKTLADVTPHELIRIARLKKAALLLTEEKHTVAEISEMTGFASPSYFSKCFARQFGATPGNYVKKLREADGAPAMH